MNSETKKIKILVAISWPKNPNFYGRVLLLFPGNMKMQGFSHLDWYHPRGWNDNLQNIVGAFEILRSREYVVNIFP